MEMTSSAPTMDFVGMSSISHISAAMLKDMPVAAGEEVCVLINGLGATSIEELYILSGSVRKLLDEKGIKTYRVSPRSPSPIWASISHSSSFFSAKTAATP